MTTYSTRHLLYLKLLYLMRQKHVYNTLTIISLSFTPQKMIHYLLELNHTSLQVQSSKAKRLLNINKLIPIYINRDTILFPLTQKRASIKYFINARKIIGIHSSHRFYYYHFRQYDSTSY